MAKNLMKDAKKIAKLYLKSARFSSKPKDIMAYTAFQYEKYKPVNGVRSNQANGKLDISNKPNHVPRKRRPEWKGLVR